MAAALYPDQVQEKAQNACQACLVHDFSTAFVQSLVSTLAQATGGQDVLVAFAGAVLTWLATQLAFDQIGFVADLVSLACEHLPDSEVAVLGQREAEAVTVLLHLRWAISGLVRTRELEVVAVPAAHLA